MSKTQILHDLRRFLLQEKGHSAHLCVESHFALQKERKALLQDTLAPPSQKQPIPSSLKKAPPPQKEKPREEKPPIHQEKEESSRKALAQQQTEEFFSLMRSIAPHITLHTTPISDDRAHEKKRAWKWFLELPEVAMIFPPSGGEIDLFLSQVAKALHTRLGSSRVLNLQKIEKSSQADMLFHAKKIKYIISTRPAIQTSPFLLKHFREMPQSGEAFLEDIPVILIDNPANYLKKPKLKKSLWDMLCQRLDKK